MKRFLVFIGVFVLLGFFPAANAEVNQEWIATYNSPLNGYDSAAQVAVDPSGNIYVAGTAGGSSSSAYDTQNDFLTIKYNSAGVKLWESRYNGPGNATDIVTSLTVDLSGNIYVAGGSVGSSGKWNFATVKYDANGAQLWVARWEHPWHWHAYVRKIAVDASGNVCVVGATPYLAGNGYDILTIKYSPDGVKQWQAAYNDPVGNGDDHGFTIAVDENENVYVAGTVAGSTHSGYYNGRQYGLIKYSPTGQQLWVAKYDGAAHGEDVATAMALDNNGNIYLTGYSDSRAYSGPSGAYFDYATVKFDPNGTQQWAARYNGPGNSADIPTSIGIDVDGNVIVTGSSVGNGTDYDYATIKYDATGAEQWVTRYNGPGNSQDQQFSPDFGRNYLALDYGGNVYVTGSSYGNSTGKDYATIKYNAAGIEQWVKRYNEAGNGNDIPYSIALDASGDIYVTGESYGGTASKADYVTIKYSDNHLPIADAGSNQKVECSGPSGSAIVLDGSASSDPDGDSLTFEWTWTGGSAEGVSPTISLPFGTTVVTLTVGDGKASSSDNVTITVQDTTPPLTTAKGGSENWYNAIVIATFSASDSCSGVKEVHYSVDGSETAVLGNYASATIITEGIHTVTYYSIDNAGNVESPRSMTVKIDKTPPILNLSTNHDTLWPPNHKMVDVTIGGGASDNLSGVASVAFTVEDEYGAVQPSIIGFNTGIALEAWRNGNDKDGRHYTITATATDAAGNKSTASAEVLVPHDQR